MSNSKPILGSKYVPKYAGNYFDRPWYEEDFMGTWNFAIIRICRRIPLGILKKKVVNFDIILHECRGDPLKGSYKNYKPINDRDIKEYLKLKKEKYWEMFLETLIEKIYGLKKVVLDHFKN